MDLTTFYISASKGRRAKDGYFHLKEGGNTDGLLDRALVCSSNARAFEGHLIGKPLLVLGAAFLSHSLGVVSKPSTPALRALYRGSTLRADPPMRAFRAAFARLANFPGFLSDFGYTSTSAIAVAFEFRFCDLLLRRYRCPFAKASRSIKELDRVLS